MQTVAQTTVWTAAQTAVQITVQTVVQTAAQTTVQTAAQTAAQTMVQTAAQTAVQTTVQTAEQTAAAACGEETSTHTEAPPKKMAVGPPAGTPVKWASVGSGPPVPPSRRCAGGAGVMGKGVGGQRARSGPSAPLCGRDGERGPWRPRHDTASITALVDTARAL